MAKACGNNCMASSRVRGGEAAESVKGRSVLRRVGGGFMGELAVGSGVVEESMG